MVTARSGRAAPRTTRVRSWRSRTTATWSSTRPTAVLRSGRPTPAATDDLFHNGSGNVGIHDGDTLRHVNSSGATVATGWVWDGDVLMTPLAGESWGFHSRRKQ